MIVQVVRMKGQSLESTTNNRNGIKDDPLSRGEIKDDLPHFLPTLEILNKGGRHDQGSTYNRDDDLDYSRN